MNNEQEKAGKGWKRRNYCRNLSASVQSEGNDEKFAVSVAHVRLKRMHFDPGGT